ncbi:MAG: hypothetical protein MUO36_04510, partial [Candidatus Hadarchaeum sp.]|nr:hypothetical protein [Candidatus Hadarchaeum sp.]
MDKKGAAPTLAIFIIFILICAAAALATFQAGHQRQVFTIQQLMAVDVVRATSSTIEVELNQTLQSAITAAMYEAGVHPENRDVENRVIQFLNERIALGWSYSNENIIVPLCDENSLVLEWLPDGSMRARAYLAAEVRHISGVVANGISLRVNVTPRFERLKKVAGIAFDLAKASYYQNLENELNDN